MQHYKKNSSAGVSRCMSWDRDSYSKYNDYTDLYDQDNGNSYKKNLCDRSSSKSESPRISKAHSFSNFLDRAQTPNCVSYKCFPIKEYYMDCDSNHAFICTVCKPDNETKRRKSKGISSNWSGKLTSNEMKKVIEKKRTKQKSPKTNTTKRESFVNAQDSLTLISDKLTAKNQASSIESFIVDKSYDSSSICDEYYLLCKKAFQLSQRKASIDKREKSSHSNQKEKIKKQENNEHAKIKPKVSFAGNNEEIEKIVPILNKQQQQQRSKSIETESLKFNSNRDDKKVILCKLLCSKCQSKVDLISNVMFS